MKRPLTVAEFAKATVGGWPMRSQLIANETPELLQTKIANHRKAHHRGEYDDACRLCRDLKRRVAGEDALG